MSTTVTVRDIEPGDKAWLRREARRMGISMEELVRRLIHKERVRAQLREKPSKAFKQYFGPKNGVELPSRQQFIYRPLQFPQESAE